MSTIAKLSKKIILSNVKTVSLITVRHKTDFSITDELLNKVDFDTTDTKSIMRTYSPKKLKRKLDPNSTIAKTAHIRKIGELEALASEIENVLNEFIQSKYSDGIFRRASLDEDMIEFEKVIINSDKSHVDAFWTSAIVNKFVKNLQLKEGDDKAEKFRTRAIKHINMTLREKEPRFRSYLMKQLSFRKVPRIFFRSLEKKEMKDGPKALPNNVIEMMASTAIEHKYKSHKDDETL